MENTTRQLYLRFTRNHKTRQLYLSFTRNHNYTIITYMLVAWLSYWLYSVFSCICRSGHTGCIDWSYWLFSVFSCICPSVGLVILAVNGIFLHLSVWSYWLYRVFSCNCRSGHTGCIVYFLASVRLSVWSY